MPDPINSITPQRIRNLDFFSVKGPDNNYQVAYYPLYEVDKNGKVTSTPKFAEAGQNYPTRESEKGQFTDAIVRDEATGRLYYKTVNQSRFLDYGLDGTNKLVAMDYAGETKEWNLGNKRDVLESGEIRAFDLTLDNGNKYQNLSISRLLIMITLKRAEQMEGKLIDQMNDLANSNAKLDSLSQIGEYLVDQISDKDLVDLKYIKITYMGEEMSIYDFLTKELGVDGLNSMVASDDEIKMYLERMKAKRGPTVRNAYDNQTQWNGSDKSYCPALFETFGPKDPNAPHAPIGAYTDYNWDNVSHSALNKKVRGDCDAGTINLDDLLLIKHKTDSAKDFSIKLSDALEASLIGYENVQYAYDITPITSSGSVIPKDDLMDIVKNKQDELNNVSQETMINIQKLITARDQSYLLGSIGTKLFQSGNLMIARNI